MCERGNSQLKKPKQLNTLQKTS